MKKGISWYMPNECAWNVQARYGNPTKSKVVNSIVYMVKKLEGGRNGKEPQMKRALLMSEFRTMLEKLESSQEFETRYRFATMMKLQYHLVARSDDIAKFKIKDVHSHSDPLLFFVCKLEFIGPKISTKNVTVRINFYWEVVTPIIVCCWLFLYISKFG